MEIDDHHYEQVLLHFATLFLLLGVIERRLRIRIPATLREYGLLINKAPWWLGNETKMTNFKREEEMMLWLVNAMGGLSSKG